jgi:hypothetical protein
MTSTQDHIATFNSFANGVVDALNAGTDATAWHVVQPSDQDQPSGLVIGDGTRELHFYLPMYGTGNKVQVVGLYPDNVPTRTRVYLHPEVNGFKGQDRPSINVSPSRPAAHVAADITRRLIPDYDAIRARIAELVSDEVDAAMNQSAALRSMATALGVPAPTPTLDRHREVRSPVSDSAGYGDFRPNHDGSTWEITLRSVPVEIAEQIAAVLAAAR